MRRLHEFIGDMTRKLDSVVDLFQETFGAMERIGGQKVYEIAGTDQQGAIYTVGTQGAAVAFGWRQGEMVETVYWWDHFDFGSPDYALDIPAGIDIQRIMPAVRQAIT